jgi:hypothetical protein
MGIECNHFEMAMGDGFFSSDSEMIASFLAHLQHFIGDVLSEDMGSVYSSLSWQINLICRP